MKYLKYLIKQHYIKMWQLRLSQRYSASVGPPQQILTVNISNSTVQALVATSSKIILNSLMYQYNTGSAANPFKTNFVCLII